jgi:hypothetical protein
LFDHIRRPFYFFHSLGIIAVNNKVLFIGNLCFHIKDYSKVSLRKVALNNKRSFSSNSGDDYYDEKEFITDKILVEDEDNEDHLNTDKIFFNRKPSLIKIHITSPPSKLFINSKPNKVVFIKGLSVLTLPPLEPFV